MSRQKPPLTTPEDSVIIRRVSRAIARIANERGMNAVELADALGLSYAYVRDLLDGKRNISVLTIEDICVKLDVPLEVLLSAYLHPEPEPTALRSRWGARRGKRDAGRELESEGEPAKPTDKRRSLN
jgi:transcriptional regulator with XRE-family HTH domain